MELDEQLPEFNKTYIQPMYTSERLPQQTVVNRSDKGKHRNKYDSKLDPKYKSYLMRANSKGLKFTITEEEFKTITSQDCHYCGSSSKIGIDRIDSKEGYVIDNCTPCCTKCNMMKYTYSEKEFISHIQRIFNHFVK